MIVVSGFSGSGKTTAILNALCDFGHAGGYREFPPFYSQRRAGKSREAYSLWTRDEQTICTIGTYNSETLNRQGADVFLYAQKAPLAHWMADLNTKHRVIYDSFFCSPTIMRTLNERTKVDALYIDTPLEVCIAEREARARKGMQWGRTDLERAYASSLESFANNDALSNFTLHVCSRSEASDVLRGLMKPGPNTQL